MKSRLIVSAALLAVLCVALVPIPSGFLAAQDKPEPTLYVQIRFESCLQGDADVEAETAWKSFVAAVDKIQGVTATFRPRQRKTAFDDVDATVYQPCLTAAQLAAFSVEVGKLLDAPCFKEPDFTMKLSRHPMAIRESQPDPFKEPRTNVPSGPPKH